MERHAARAELVRLMKERFLECASTSLTRCPRPREISRCIRIFGSGEDATWFDYAAVDGDERLDDVEQQGRDAEERWFDDSDDEL